MWSPLESLVKPNSPILGHNSLSRKMLLAFKPRRTILYGDSSCRYRSPCAIPLMIIKRVSQPNCPRLTGSATDVKISLHLYENDEN